MDEVRVGVEAEVGEEFEVKLDSVPGTGAIWYFKPNKEGPELVRQSSEPRMSSPGSAVTQTFVFRSHRQGTYELPFELKRAWEPQVRRRATATVSVGSPPKE